MTAHKPMTPADHIARAKSEALAGDASYAVAHALIAIAELLATNHAEAVAAALVDGAAVGATATAQALGTVLGIVNPEANR